MKHFGVLAHSWEGGSLCFRAFCHRGFSELGRFEHPDVTLDCIAFGRSMRAWETGDHDSIRAILALSVDRLARAGADFFACPDNTAHVALERPGEDLALPGLHIAEVVADRAALDGFERVGILGTRYTMEGPLYPRVLGARGIVAEVPDAADRHTVNDIIFRELVHGAFSDESRREYVRVVDRLAARGCDAVALVCTEIPLLVTPEVSPLPTLDSPRLLADAAFDVALARRHADMARWSARTTRRRCRRSGLTRIDQTGRRGRGRPSLSSTASPLTTSGPAMRSCRPSRTTSARGEDRSRSAASAFSVLRS